MVDPAARHPSSHTPRLHTLVLFPDLAELIRLAAWVDEVGNSLSLSMQRLYALQLCLQELAAAAIVNAKPRINLPMSIVVTLIPQLAGLEVRVEHNGQPCDITQLPTPADSDSVIALPALQLTYRFGRNVAIDHNDNQSRITLLLPA